MGIVNPPDVHPAIMRALYRLCVELGSGFVASEQDYVAMLAPSPPINEGEDPSLSARLTVEEATEIGLLEPRGEGANRRLGLALPIPPEGADGPEAERFFVRELRRLILRPANNSPLFPEEDADDEAEGKREPAWTVKSREFSRIQAWVLHQGPLGVALNFAQKDAHRNVQLLEGRYANRDLVGNATRWNSFRRWSLYLGFSRQTAQSAVIADPTEAVSDELVDIDDGSGEIALVDLRSSLAERLPVLDGGSYREDVLRHIGAQETPEDFSPSLSLALLRAERAGLLSLVHRADFAAGTPKVGSAPFTHAVFEARR